MTVCRVDMLAAELIDLLCFLGAAYGAGVFTGALVLDSGFLGHYPFAKGMRSLRDLDIFFKHLSAIGANNIFGADFRAGSFFYNDILFIFMLAVKSVNDLGILCAADGADSFT